MGLRDAEWNPDNDPADRPRARPSPLMRQRREEAERLRRTHLSNNSSSNSNNNDGKSAFLPLCLRGMARARADINRITDTDKADNLLCTAVAQSRFFREMWVASSGKWDKCHAASAAQIANVSAKIAEKHGNESLESERVAAKLAELYTRVFLGECHDAWQAAAGQMGSARE